MYCTNILALTFRLYNTTPWEKNYTSTHALRADVCRTNLVSMTRVSLWLVSILSKKRVSLKIIYLVTHNSWRLKIEWFPRNHDWSKIQYLMYMLLVLCSTSYHMRLKVNVAHAVWPGLLVSTITVSRMQWYTLLAWRRSRKTLIFRKLFTLRL